MSANGTVLDGGSCLGVIASGAGEALPKCASELVKGTELTGSTLPLILVGS